MPLMEGEVEGWIRAFLFTQLVEVPLYIAVMSSKRLAPPRALWARFCIAFLCSLITHPVVWFVFPRILAGYDNYVYMVIAAETFAVGIEALVLMHFQVRLAPLVSLGVNMSSMSLGFLLRVYFDWV
jgi:hypothetical protein